MIYGGIDGCSKGWIVVYYSNESYHYKIIEHFKEIKQLFDKRSRMLVDIPIGLTSQHFTRTIDKKMRTVLKHRSSTVFNAPAREALAAKSKAEARNINIAITGKSLSEQTLNITPKIKEVDDFLRSKDVNTHKIAVYESHPEICFRFLTGDVVSSKKSTPEGVAERLAIITAIDKRATDLYRLIEMQELRKDVKRDDILDAICLCLVNKLSGNDTLQKLEDENTIDECGMNVGIVYYEQ